MEVLTNTAEEGNAEPDTADFVVRFWLTKSVAEDLKVAPRQDDCLDYLKSKNGVDEELIPPGVLREPGDVDDWYV